MRYLACFDVKQQKTIIEYPRLKYYYYIKVKERQSQKGGYYGKAIGYN